MLLMKEEWFIMLVNYRWFGDLIKIWGVCVISMLWENEWEGVVEYIFLGEIE